MRLRHPVRVAVAAVVVVGLAGIALVLSGGDAEVSKRSPRPTTTTTTEPPPPLAPLTNYPDTSGLSLTRSALWVKIENSPEARPQSGLEVADVVYEEVVEGGITRFWAVFNAATPETVGPIRSVRAMDPNIVTPLGGVLAYSGGTQGNVAAIRGTGLVWVDENNAGDAFFREPTRRGPHNLYGRTALLWARGGLPVPPPPLFTFLSETEDFVGEPVQAMTLGFSRPYDPTYTFDAATNTWARAYGATPHVAASGVGITPTNVIVQFVTYTGSGGEGQLIGSGDVWVFSNGQLVRGRWYKPDAVTPTVFVDALGAPIRLQPGRTWVELLPTGAPVYVVAPPPTSTTVLPR